MAINSVLAGEGAAPALFNINKSGVTPKMKLRFFPYELRLRHVFTVAAYSRTTTPDVQVEIEYDGIIGYGASVAGVLPMFETSSESETIIIRLAWLS
jgi:L-alanine-DL-glutamate epimerase-like enolase superfamily enzyme